jgi:site-specific recombinase XerD
MRDLNWEIKELCEDNLDGSFATQDGREHSLDAFANRMAEMGLTKLTLRGIKPKHIEAYVKHMQEKGLATGTIKKEMSHLRWMAEKIGKQNIVARTNDAYGIGRRTYVTNESKARELTAHELSKVTDKHSALSLQLQAAFGLRREESLKIRPGKADRGDRLVLDASWCKGGRERAIPIRNSEQRTLLNAAKEFAKGGSLIPADKSYKEHLRQFRTQCDKAGISKVHGHRHQYAQQRYKELTGRACPACGGLTAKQLIAEQKLIDRKARLIISAELGHGREQITAVYCGQSRVMRSKLAQRPPSAESNDLDSA